MKLSAAIHVLLVDQWLYDQTLDRTWLWRLARSFIQPQTEKATQLLSFYQPVLESVQSFTDRQTLLEDKKSKLTPVEAAEPTGELLALLFESLIAPMSPRYDDTDLISTLGNLGRSLGIVIYLIDALEDLEDDQKTKQFSVCLSKDFKPDPAQIDVVLSILKLKQKELSELLLKLPLVRHQALLNHIISDRLNTKVLTLAEKHTHHEEISTNLLSHIQQKYQRGSQVIHALVQHFTFGVSYAFKRLKLRFWSFFKSQPKESYLLNYQSYSQTSSHSSCPSCGPQTSNFLANEEDEPERDNDNNSCCDLCGLCLEHPHSCDAVSIPVLC